MLGLPAALAAFPLAVDWAHASRALLFKATPLGSTSGHVSPLVAAWGGHASVLLRGAAAGAAVVVAARAGSGAPVRDGTRLLAALGVCFLLRGMLEPVGFAYYLGPGAAALGLAAWVATVRGKGRAWADRWSVSGPVVAWAAAAGVVLWSLWVHGSGWAWWVPEVALTAVLAWASVAAVGRASVGGGIRDSRAASATLFS
jgi:hypothetical protein